MNIFYCIEDELSRAVAQRLISVCCPAGTTFQELGQAYGGFGYIRKNLSKFCRLALRSPVLIITDLDRAECPPSLRASWLISENINEPLPKKMVFCIAKAEIESWLLADRVGVSAFLGISSTKIPLRFENSVVDAKEFMVDLARASRHADIRSDLTPAKNSRAATGLSYNYRLSQFVNETWNPVVAKTESISLNRAIERLTSLVA